jgi:cytochrome c oxidase accessory protein FixG
MSSLVPDFFTLQAGGWVIFWVLFFACTYGNAGWMRAIMYPHVPLCRFQSAMFDRTPYIVSWQPAWRDPQRPWSQSRSQGSGAGDCIDCDLCVQVCPTSIDIRDGLQYDCINCGACVDACDQTMERMGYPGLISYTTEHKLAHSETQVARPKLIGSGLVMVVMLGIFVYNAMSIMPMGLGILRDHNQLFRKTARGSSRTPIP